MAIGDPFTELLACPQCSGPLLDLACAPCNRRYESPGGIPNLRIAADARTEAVRAFYCSSPFPGYPAHETLASLRARAMGSEFARLLDQALPARARFLELGCGTGQMCLYLATAGRVIVGADLSRPSLELAAGAAMRFGIDRALFVETDLRSPGLRRGAFDVVYASGVLHHTPDPQRSFASMAALVKPGGYVVLGLYNAYARLPHRLRRAVARLSRFRVIPFDPVLRSRRAEPARREAWLRDQYLHPEEHRHTLAEVKRWFRRQGIDYLRAYPSALLGADPSRPADLFSAEDDWAFEHLLSQLGWMRTLGAEGGLFVVVGRREPRGNAPVDATEITRAEKMS